MTPERWRRITEIFHAARERSAASRAALLEEACAGDGTLRSEVEAMLDADRDAGAFGDAPAATSLDLEDMRPTAESPSGKAMAATGEGPAGIESAFGPYRVTGKLGEGGMGVVYLAERSDGQFARTVAIKRLGTAASRSDILRRFLDERRILAQLDHPNIACLFDAGVDGAGLPYLVMEHVHGVPITSYCREQSLPVRQRLGLFLKVCEAVQHAHRSLVIHRDIKPGNILVTPGGDPKLLDFGIAKVVGETDSADATRTLNRAFTLGFASPEQVRGDAVTTASDVYSLGVLLYELLSDAAPYEVSGRSLAEAVRLVCEAVPPPASRVAPAERRGELAGDLDSIAAKAMEKVPADRYGSVAELAADVAAHLAHQPVKARRPSVGYLSRKFVRRHRAGAVVAALLLLSLSGGVVTVMWQARVAERERARAQQRFDQVRQLANYVIYELQDGIASLAGSTELRKKMVERSIVYVDSLAAEAAGDPRLQVELAGAYVRLGDVLGRPSAANLGDPEGALRSYGKARDLLSQVLSRAPQESEARRSLARLLVSMHTTLQRYRPEAALAPLQESMAIWEELVRDDPGGEDNLRGLASAHFSAALPTATGEPRMSHMERALEIFGKLLARSPDDPDRKRNVALCHKYLAGFLTLKDPPRALSHGMAAAQLDAERLRAQPHDPRAKIDYAFDVGWLGDYHRNQADLPEALRHLEESLALRREVWSADQADANARDRLAYMLMKVAEVHMLMGRHQRAAPLLREAIAHARAVPAPSFGTRLTLAKAYLFQGEVAAAAKGNPCPWYRRMAELLLTLPQRTVDENFDLKTGRWRDRAVQYVKSCPAGAPQ